MERSIRWLIGAFILVVIIIVIIILVLAFDRPSGPTGATGPFGPTGQTGQTGSSPCGNATVYDQLCLLNGAIITLTSVQTGGQMGICRGDVLDSANWCEDSGVLNFASTSPNVPNSTNWQVLRSNNNQFIALYNTNSDQYLTNETQWTVCFPCTYGYGCNGPVSTASINPDPDDPGADPAAWFTINLIDLISGTIQLITSNNSGVLGSDSSQMNSNSCANMVASNYSLSDSASQWTIDFPV